MILQTVWRAAQKNSWGGCINPPLHWRGLNTSVPAVARLDQKLKRAILLLNITDSSVYVHIKLRLGFGLILIIARLTATIDFRIQTPYSNDTGLGLHGAVTLEISKHMLIDVTAADDICVPFGPVRSVTHSTPNDQSSSPELPTAGAIT